MINSNFTALEYRKKLHSWQKSIQLFCVTALILILQGCAVLNPTMPIQIPIDLSKAGSVAEAEFWIPTDDRVVLGLSFFVNTKQGDSQRLSGIVGGFGRKGIIIPLKVKLLKQNSEQDLVSLEKLYLNDGLRGVGVGSKSIDRTVDRINIKSGAYRLKVETVESFTQLVDTLVLFEIYYSRAPK